MTAKYFQPMGVSISHISIKLWKISTLDFLKKFWHWLREKNSKISIKEGDKHLLLQIAEDFEDLNMVN